MARDAEHHALSRSERGIILPIAVIEILSGSIGGITQALASHPLDTIKVRMQTMGQYNGMLHCASMTIRQEGVSGLFAGIQSPLLGSARSVISSITGDDPRQLKPYQCLIAGATVGAIAAIVDTPMEFLKCQMQIPGTTHKNIIETGRHVVHSSNVFGLYRGFFATVNRNIPAYGIYFGAYESIRNRLSRGEARAATWKILLSGGLAGLCCWTIAYPTDTIKSIIQTDHVSQGKKKYRGVIHATSSIWKTSGVRGFYKGFLPCIYRSFISNAVCFWGYENSKHLLLSQQ
ncbi:hypothetical protein PROFUN_11192 [Planoprotostelium fungivorum]|uniref:Mitochondrial carrier protein n=1 Tax=Planoprotostelium fungivorum TaxID=1890364 RepID=A0A2P6NAU6_9EUKA|nr:hypothetical protein PROFUN_11192 [Planoprotostelium fungivorum]